MSRVGKQAVAIPQGVEVAIKPETISVKGALGAMELAQSALVKVESADGKLSFSPVDESREANAMSGTIRQLVNNMVNGVSKGFEKKLTPDRRGLQSRRLGQQAQPGRRFLAPGELRDARWHHGRHPDPDRNRDQGC